MKTKDLYIAMLLVAVLLIAGCKKSDSSINNQTILFHYDHTTGQDHTGYIIDNEGNVYTYNNDVVNFPDNDLEINQDKADEYIGKCEYTGIKIETKELNKYARYIEYIASSKVTAPRDTKSDSGTIRYICYQFDESTGIYTGHLIRMEGDYTRENLNFHSRRISSWMKKLQNELSF
jgi:hypothetical protein